MNLTRTIVSVTWKKVIRNKAYIFLLIFSLLFLYSFYGSINLQGENSISTIENGAEITIFPQQIYVGTNSVTQPLLEIIINNTIDQQSSILIVLQSGNNKLLESFSLLPHQFERIYIPLNSSILAVHQISITISSGREAFTSYVSVENTLLPLIFEISFLLSILFYGLFFYYFKSGLRYVPIMILAGYFAISPFMGQRYDMYFMIFSPLKLILGSNPFLTSSSVPGGLKWEYPPVYLFYGGAVEIVLTKLHMLPMSGFIYPGILWKFNNMDWRGLVNPNLPLYYLLLKIPFIISTFSIYLVLKNRHPETDMTRSWLLNPAVILIGVIWGQLDVVASLTLILSVLYLERGRTDLAILFATLGGFVKIFPLFIIPIILFKSRKKVRDIMILIIVSLFSIIPYIVAGNVFGDILEMVYSRGVPTYSNLFDANGISWQVILMDLGFKNFPSLSLFIFLPFFVGLTVYYYFKGGNLSIWLIAIFSCFFLTYNFVNPQYFILVLPLFIILKKTRFFIIYSLIPSVYILLNYSLPYFVNPYYAYNYYASPLGQMEHIRLYITGGYVIMWSFIIISAAVFSYTLFWALRGLRDNSWNDFPDFMAFPRRKVDP